MWHKAHAPGRASSSCRELWGWGHPHRAHGNDAVCCRGTQLERELLRALHETSLISCCSSQLIWTSGLTCVEKRGEKYSWHFPFVSPALKKENKSQNSRNVIREFTDRRRDLFKAPLHLSGFFSLKQFTLCISFMLAHKVEVFPLCSTWSRGCWELISPECCVAPHPSVCRCSQQNTTALSVRKRRAHQKPANI